MGCGGAAAPSDESGDTGASAAADTSTTGALGCEQGDASMWLDRSASEQVDAVRDGEVCCEALIDGYVDRISTDPDGINPMIAWDASVRPTGGDALACMIVAVKDNIDVLGFSNTAGSLTMTANAIDVDAPAIAGLRAAGAVVLGKANLSEWANFRGYGSTSGWSSVGGQTKNGAASDYNPCGSSSGSAAAVAAGMIAAAVGTETSGSIVCPSSVNGVVGMKPTLGLVSRSGIIPIAHSHDTAGPITRTVEDAAMMLEAMAGADADDPATGAIPAGFDFDFSAALDGASLDGTVLGYSSSFANGFSADQRAVYDAALADMSDAGATLVDIALPPSGALGGPFLTVLLTEFKAGLNAYLAGHAASGVPGSLADIIAQNQAEAATIMPHFGQEYFTQAEATAGLSDPGYLAALAQVTQGAGADGLLVVLDANALDAIVIPTTGPAWPTNYATGDANSDPSAAFLPAAAGYPHLTVPMGRVDDRPVGLSFIGRAWDDASILALGHAFASL
jgi:amidase